MLKDAEIFINVVENQSFSKAARKLKLTAPIVTRHIAKLENEIGVRLLQRNTRNVSLTEAGVTFYESCLDLLKTYSLTLKQVKNFTNELVGTLKIGLPSSISQLYITESLNQFLKKYPDINIDIINGNHLIDLLSDGFDLIIHCGELSDSNLYCRKLGEWNKVTCASPSYFKRHGTPKIPDDLRNQNCLDHYDNVDQSWKYTIDGSIKSIPVSGNIRANSSIDLRNLALSGVGIVYLPSFTVKNEIKLGTLKNILNDYGVPSLSMYAVYPTNRFLSNKAKVFLDFLDSLEITEQTVYN